MANINPIYKRAFERYLEMESGYVLNFNNKTFAEYVAETTGINIEDSKYCQDGDSKAKRLRAFIKLESPALVAKLLDSLIDYKRLIINSMKSIPPTQQEETIYNQCKNAIDELRKDISYIEWQNPLSDNEEDFEKLSKNIQAYITNNQLDLGIDRLHTFCTKYFRKICEKRGIITTDKPLQSLLGEYIKFLTSNNLIQSEMSKRILKSSISIIDAFNDVRNNKSLAHDNNLLDYDECTLIFINTSALINFIKAKEEQVDKILTPPKEETKGGFTWDDLPF